MKKTQESLIESLKGSTTAASYTFSSFFDWETKSDDPKLHEVQNDPIIREYQYFESHSENDEKLEFTVNTSFFSQNMTVLFYLTIIRNGY